MQCHLFCSDIFFRVITLWEPPKAEMIPYLDLEHQGKEPPNRPARLAKVQAYVDKELYEFKIDLDKQLILDEEDLTSRQSHIDPEYMRKAEMACIADPKVQEQVAALKLPEEATVVVEPWTYGPDGMSDMSQRVTMVRLIPRKTDLYLPSDILVLVLHASHFRPRRKLLRLPAGPLR